MSKIDISKNEYLTNCSVGEPAEGSLLSKGLLGPTSYTLFTLPYVASAVPVLPEKEDCRGVIPSGPLPVDGLFINSVQLCRLSIMINKLKLSTTDLLVLASMKNAAKCDK
jgi:hypothetical protein